MLQESKEVARIYITHSDLIEHKNGKDNVLSLIAALLKAGCYSGLFLNLILVWNRLIYFRAVKKF